MFVNPHLAGAAGLFTQHRSWVLNFQHEPMKLLEKESDGKWLYFKLLKLRKLSYFFGVFDQNFRFIETR